MGNPVMRVEAHKAYLMATMTPNSRAWIETAEAALWQSIICGQSNLDLKTLQGTGFPLNDNDWDSLLYWFSLYDYDVDRKRKLVLIPHPKDKGNV